MSIESKIKEVSARYGYCSISVRDDKFKISSGNYDQEESYTYNYETDYYNTLNEALNAYLKGKKKLQEN